MKHTFIIAMFTAAVLTSCSGQNGSEATTGKETAMVAAAGSTAENATAEPVYLTTREFKEKVMDFDKNPKDWVFEGDKPCIVDFYADWCRPCRMIAPIMEDLAREYDGKIDIYKVNTDKERELAAVFNITSIPYVLFVPAKGSPSAQRGALPKESYKQIIDEFLLKSVPASETGNINQ